ncbi:ABC transporter family substrate-binding protein [Streptomyces sp. NPDC050610]|uniref:ABC transporter family substrate-binding protein n=1 Tax=Streptomyces sp. NPDC050610 TaxID=3157097 RepID=UPI0034144B9D
MSHDGVPRGTAPRTGPLRRARRRRRAALLTAGALLPLPALAGCGSGGGAAAAPPAPMDVARTARAAVADRGALRWAVDELPGTLNAFQADADAGTERVAGAVLPALFTLDQRGRPRRNPDYLRSAETVEREPKQIVVYKLNPKAVWSDGRALGAADFAAQWKALSGKDHGYWTARNAGYDRIEKVEPGAKPHEVKVTFARPYADWAGLFTPLYPQSVMGSPDAFNDSARKDLKATAGPFEVAGRDTGAGTLTLARNPKWWGDRAKLDKLVLRAVPRERRPAALTADTIDLAAVDPATAANINAAHKPAERGRKGAAGSPGDGTGGRAAAAAMRAWAEAHGTPEAREKAAAAAQAERAATARTAARATALRSYTVRKSLEPAYTQLALNGASGPLADERVRRAVARAIDRKELAAGVLGPLGLPAKPLGSHLLMAGQQGYEDHSGAVGGVDAQAAQALLADAGWQSHGGPIAPKKAGGDADIGTDTKADSGKDQVDGGSGPEGSKGPDGAHGPKDPKDPEAAEAAEDAGAGRSKAVAAPVRMKNGQKLALRFVLPRGAAAEPLRAVGDRIARDLDAIGVRTEITKVADDSYFKDHIASGGYDLALYSWPATAYPATDARPIFAKPQPAPDGSLLVEQNYTRVGTDQIDQLFDQAAAELDAGASRDLVERADARIWAAAGSIPLYQRPELIAAKSEIANAGAFGLATPRYQDIGFRK